MQPAEGRSEGGAAQTVRLAAALVFAAVVTFGLLVWWSYQTGETEHWPLAKRLTQLSSPTVPPTSSAESVAYSFSGGRVSITGLRLTEEGEEVILTNQGGASQALSSWRLCKGEEECFVFPEGFLLEPGVSVRIWSGRTKPSEAFLGLHWTEQTIWKESRASVVLRDASGEIVSRFEY